MSALDDAIPAVQQLADLLETCGAAARQAIDVTGDAIEAAAAFGSMSHVATLEQVQDDVAEAMRILTTSGERTLQARDTLLALRGEASGTGREASSSQRGGRKSPAKGAGRFRQKQPRDADAEAPRRRRPSVDAVVAYSPPGAAFSTGVAALLFSPNKIVGVALLAAGTAADALGVAWDRRKKRKDDQGEG